jgi:hypothetical protein
MRIAVRRARSGREKPDFFAAAARTKYIPTSDNRQSGLVARQDASGLTGMLKSIKAGEIDINAVRNDPAT